MPPHRAAHSVDQSTADEVESQLADLRTAADDDDLEGAAEGAEQLRELLAGVAPAD